MQQLTPQQRNQIIDEMIMLLKRHDCYTICYAVNNTFEDGHSTIEQKFEILGIPIIRPLDDYWWPRSYTNHRILFLKSIKTCHK